MSMSEYLTDGGKELIAQMLAGKIQLTFTKVQIGNGVLTTGQSRLTMTSLVNVVATLDVERVSISDDNLVTITAIFNNSLLTEGFYYREKGVFASDGTNEVLFAYANSGNSAEWIDPPTVSSVEKKITSYYKSLQDQEVAVNITVKSGVYALQTDLDTLDEKVGPLTALTTTIKTSIVNAINWIASNLDLKVNKADVIESTAITENGKVMGGKTAADEFAKINQSLTPSEGGTDMNIADMVLAIYNETVKPSVKVKIGTGAGSFDIKTFITNNSLDVDYTKLNNDSFFFKNAYARYYNSNYGYEVTTNTPCTKLTGNITLSYDNVTGILTAANSTNSTNTCYCGDIWLCE